RLALEGDGWRFGVTNLDKELWPPHGERPAVTKRDLLRYALATWPTVGPHLRDRLLTLTRYPDGIGAGHFYQRHWDDKRPEFVETATVFSDTEGKDRTYLLCNNLPTLLWLCQVADIEWHTGLGRVSPPGRGESAPAVF